MVPCVSVCAVRRCVSQGGTYVTAVAHTGCTPKSDWLHTLCHRGGCNLPVLASGCPVRSRRRMALFGCFWTVMVRTSVSTGEIWCDRPPTHDARASTPVFCTVSLCDRLSVSVWPCGAALLPRTHHRRRTREAASGWASHGRHPTPRGGGCAFRTRGALPTLLVRTNTSGALVSVFLPLEAAHLRPVCMRTCAAVSDMSLLARTRPRVGVPGARDPRPLGRSRLDRLATSFALGRAVSWRKTT